MIKTLVRLEIFIAFLLLVFKHNLSPLCICSISITPLMFSVGVEREHQPDVLRGYRNGTLG